MNELYWFTRLDSINSASDIFMTASGLFFVVALAIYICLNAPQLFDCEDKELSSIAKTGIKTCALIFMISLLIKIFVPTTKEAFVIWGVGGTIDYLKSNEKAMKLPDKCIDALDKFISEYAVDNDRQED